MYIKKYQKEKLKQNRTMMTLGGCIYHLAVRCLDFTDFGSIQIPSLMPRICVWKGDMVKHLSDMTIGRDGKYGCLTIKEVSETYYKDGTHEWASTIKNSNFRKAINNVAGNSLSDKVKEDIFLAYENHMKNEDLNTCIKAKGLLLDSIRIITNASGESGDTVKVGSTGTELNASQQSNNSGDTVKLQSTELQEENDGGHLVQRKRRKTNVLSTSQQSAGSSVSKTNAGKGSRNEADGFCSSPPKVHEIGKLKSDSVAQCQREHSSKDPMPEMCAPAASTFTPGNQDGAILIQYKRRRIDAQSSSEPHDPCSIKHKKPLEALLKEDKKIPSKQGEEKDEVHTLDNQQEKSSSLNYMLIGEAKENHVQNVAESAKEDIPTELIQSKIIFTESKRTTFSGFQNTSIQELDLQRKNSRGRPDNLSIDINVKAQPESGTHTDEVFARGYKIISDFLDKAREKYFFAEDSTPSFRISEDVDECGNIIEEHELWRPVWMKDECYNKKQRS
ncbi:uncharacterized protein [Triticum aestivum]|uniref:uncharacterized protein n=1 Tax=Triticum aestivum TaxID=4565 RepID=UPI001D00F0F5|nr:uncharacterized protein LOC123075758 [Triticum aestivum]